MSKLFFCRYSPSKGGHAPNHIRDAFLEILDRMEDREPGEPVPSVEIGDREMSISDVCGLLWNCTDVLPGGARDAIEEMLYERGEDQRLRVTYAAGARALKRLLSQETA